MKEKTQAMGNNNSVLNDSRATDSYNTANSHNVDNHSVDNHSVDSHNTQVINNNGMSVHDLRELHQIIEEERKKAREEAKRDIEEKLQNTAAVPSYSRGVDLSQVEPIPGSEVYHPKPASQVQTPQQSASSVRQTVNYESQKRSSHLGTIVAVICGAVLAGGIFLFTGKKADKVEQTAKSAEVTVSEQKQQPVVAQTSSAPKKQQKQAQASSKSTTSSSTRTSTATTTTQQAYSAPKQEYVPVQEVQTRAPAPTVNPFDEAKAKADAGDAASCYKVAKAYQEGNGVGKSLSSAFTYMKSAADKGYTPAYIEVAKMYHGGRGVTKDRDVAEQWYKRAADAGNSEAKRILLNM